MRLLEKALKREGSSRQRFRETDPVRECSKKKMLGGGDSGEWLEDAPSGVGISRMERRLKM